MRAPAPPKSSPGANGPRQAAKPRPAAPKGAEGIAAGDEVYIRHPKQGAMAVKVAGVGTHGFNARCAQGKRHRVPFDRYLGHRARMSQRYELVDQGVDGALVRDAKGQHRFLAGAPASQPEAATGPDDPILGGMDRLQKATPKMPALLILKALPPPQPKGGKAPPPGNDNPDPKAGRKPPAKGAKPAAKPTMRHGDVARFRHGDVEGQGRIVASGADGVTLQDDTGRSHQVRHDALLPPDAAGPDGGGAAPGKGQDFGQAGTQNPGASGLGQDKGGTMSGQGGQPPGTGGGDMTARATALAQALVLFFKPDAPGGAPAGAPMAKAHVRGYTTKKGTYVAEHDDKRQASLALASTAAPRPKRMSMAEQRNRIAAKLGNGVAHAKPTEADHWRKKGEEIPTSQKGLVSGFNPQKHWMVEHEGKVYSNANERGRHIATGDTTHKYTRRTYAEDGHEEGDSYDEIHIRENGKIVGSEASAAEEKADQERQRAAIVARQSAERAEAAKAREARRPKPGESDGDYMRRQGHDIPISRKGSIQGFRGPDYPSGGGATDGHVMVEHNGKIYSNTGKTGTHNDSSEKAYEFRHRGMDEDGNPTTDQRIWVRAGGQIHED